MSKKHLFVWYAFITAMILAFARLKLMDLPELTNANMLAVNFGLVQGELKLRLLNANLILFDFVSILGARVYASSVDLFLEVRKVSFMKRWRAFGKVFALYLLPALIVHLFLFNVQNMIISWGILILFALVWVVLVGMPLYKWPSWLRVVAILAVLIIIRIIV